MRISLYRLLFLFLLPCTSLVYADLLKNQDSANHKASMYINGDPRADAPTLAYRGNYDVGVKTIELTNLNQIDILNYTDQSPNPRYDRPLTLEVWYPAKLKRNQKQITTYHDSLGSGPGNPARPIVPFTFKGRAARNARPDRSAGPFPLVIVSHGYPGSRVLLSYLTENLASKGYVVAAIDHTDSTHADKVGFTSTLLNRPLDINFVLRTLARRNLNPSSIFHKMVDASSTALIGYSMGGYGSLIAAGAGLSEFATTGLSFYPGDSLKRLRAGSKSYERLLDERIAAVVLFAPWGGSFGIWDQQGLSGLKVPSLFIVGNMDRTAPYDGVQFLFDNAVNSDRYMLLYQNGIHEIAVNPTPPEAFENYAEFIHYQEPAWDNKRCNNVNQHFVSAFLGMHLKSENTDYASYLNLLEPIANNSPRTNDGTDPTFWKGFTDYTAVGLEMHYKAAQ